MTVTGGWAWVAANARSDGADIIVYRLDLNKPSRSWPPRTFA